MSTRAGMIDLLIECSDLLHPETLERIQPELLSHLYETLNDPNIDTNATIKMLDYGYGENHVAFYLLLKKDWDAIIGPIDFSRTNNKDELFESLSNYEQQFPDQANDYDGPTGPNTRAMTAILGTTLAIQQRLAATEGPYHSSRGMEDKDVLIHYLDGHSPVLHEDIVELLIERPDHWRQIADIAITRYTHNKELITSLLDTEYPALSSGII